MYPVSEISPRSKVPPACRSLDDPLGGWFGHEDEVRSLFVSSEAQYPSRLAGALFHAEISEDGIVSIRRGAWARTMDRTCPCEHAAGLAQNPVALVERALEKHGMFSSGGIPGSH